MNYGIGFTRLTQDNIVNEGATWLYGWHIQASADGGDVSFYEGLDSSSGRLLATVKALANDPNPFITHIPFFLDRGLYVDIGSNVTAVTLFWLPDPPNYVGMLPVEVMQRLMELANG